MAAILITSVVFALRSRRIKCCGCGKSLNLYKVIWEEKLTMIERLNIESYVEISKLYQCRCCHRLQCIACAMKAKLHCRVCKGNDLRTGYFVS